jgi:hypothetical protein
MLLLLVLHSPINDIVHRLGNNDAIAASQSDERVWSLFDILNQVTVQNERFAIESS